MQRQVFKLLAYNKGHSISCINCKLCLVFLYLLSRRCLWSDTNKMHVKREVGSKLNGLWGGRGGVGGARFPAACRLPSNVCSVLPSIHFLTPSPPLSHFHTLWKKWKWPMQYLQAIDTHWHQEAKLKSQVTSCLPPLLQCVLPSIHIFTLVFFVKSESDICRTCCKLL